MGTTKVIRGFTRTTLVVNLRGINSVFIGAKLTCLQMDLLVNK